MENLEITGEPFPREVDESGSFPSVLASYPNGIYINAINVTLRNVVSHNTPGILIVNEASSGLLVDGYLGIEGGWRSRSDPASPLVSEDPALPGGHGHGAYIQNASGISTMRRSVLGRNGGYAGHWFGVEGNVNGVDVDENYILKRLIIGNYSGANPTNNRVRNNVIVNDQTFLGYDNDHLDLEVTNNRFISNGFVAIRRVRDLVFTGNTVITRQRAVQYEYPSVVVSADVDNNLYNVFSSPNKLFPFFVNGQHVNLTNWQNETGFDLNSQVVDVLPDNFNRLTIHNPERAFLYIEDWQDQGIITIDLTGLDLIPAVTYELVNVDAYFSERLLFNGTDSLDITMADWSIEKPVGWGIPWMSSLYPTIGCWLIRKVGTV